ncbi:MAG TPA: Hsp20/alpha crystallin family protein [Syntrophales bacterium]|nr:Hsp20/alpha crystallin family protein [Syntrophales bacterium]
MFWQDFRRLGRGWDPFREVETLRREMNRLFTQADPRSAQGSPALNIWVQDQNVLVTAELPGIDVQDIDISVIGETLTLKGERKADVLKEGESYHRRERGSGSFARTVKLPFRVEADKVTAKYERGILQVTLPRAEEDKPKKIQIKSK